MPYTYEYPRPALTVDACLLTTIHNKLHLLLIQRKYDPYKEMWALPGGFVDDNETAEDGILREMQEETGLQNLRLYQLFTNSNLNRDPRGRTVSVVYFGFLPPNSETIIAGDDAAQVRWFPLHQLPQMAFDHSMHIQALLLKLKQKTPGTLEILSLLPEKFTHEQLMKLLRQTIETENEVNRWVSELEQKSIIQPTDAIKELYQYVHPTITTLNRYIG